LELPELYSVSYTSGLHVLTFEKKKTKIPIKMPHKKFPRMSQAQLKRLIKSQNQNIAKAACILEPPKIIQQPSMRQSIIPPNPAYSKKQGKNAARPNSERAGKVPMQGLNHVVPEDTVKQVKQ